jgi:ribosomal protein S18 acetylase RimI-like enzyme
MTADAAAPAPAAVLLARAPVLLRPADAAALDAAADLAAAVFAADEPMTAALAAAAADGSAAVRAAAREVAGALASGAAARGVAAALYDADGGLAGIFLCDALADAAGAAAEPQLLHPWPAALAPVGALLHDLSADFRQLRAARLAPGEAPPTRTLRLAMLAVAPHWQRRGVARALLAAVEAEARRRGFGDLIAEATAPGSRALLRRAGFEELLSVSYGEYERAGARPFARAAGGAALVWRRAGAATPG